MTNTNNNDDTQSSLPEGIQLPKSKELKTVEGIELSNTDAEHEAAAEKFLKKQKAANDEAENKKRENTKKLLERTHLKLQYPKSFFRINRFIFDVIKIVRDPIEIAAKIIAPLYAAVVGVLAFIEFWEALFLKKEIMQLRVVKAANAVAVAAFYIAAAILTFNPVTAPLAAALTAAAMFCAVLRDLSFIYHAYYERKGAQINYTNAQYNLDFFYKTHSYDLKAEAKLKAEVGRTKIALDKAQEKFYEKRRTLVSNALSCASSLFLALCAFAAIGAIAANPIALGVVGVVALGFAIVSASYNLYKKNAAHKKIKAAEAAALINAESNEDIRPQHKNTDQPEPTHQYTHEHDSVIICQELGIKVGGVKTGFSPVAQDIDQEIDFAVHASHPQAVADPHVFVSNDNQENAKSADNNSHGDEDGDGDGDGKMREITNRYSKS